MNEHAAPSVYPLRVAGQLDGQLQGDAVSALADGVGRTRPRSGSE